MNANVNGKDVNNRGGFTRSLPKFAGLWKVNVRVRMCLSFRVLSLFNVKYERQAAVLLSFFFCIKMSMTARCKQYNYKYIFRGRVEGGAK